MQRNYPSHVQLTKVHEGGEPAEFKALFASWERERLPGQVKPVGNRICKHFALFNGLNCVSIFVCVLVRTRI